VKILKCGIGGYTVEKFGFKTCVILISEKQPREKTVKKAGGQNVL
jgi:hypothetical protein